MATPSPTFESIRRALSAGQYAPVYFLHGAEGYYIDELVKLFEGVLPVDDRPYGLTNVYAPRTDSSQAVADLCRSIPMMTDRQVVILREVQSVKAEWLDKLIPYVSAPTPSTILVVAVRGADSKASKFIKAVQAGGGVVYQSKTVYPNQLPRLIEEYARSRGLTTDPRGADLLADHVGTNLSTLFNEIDKLASVLGPRACITPEVIERYVGISKEYNSYELLDAIAARDFSRMIRIVEYFGANPKQGPFPAVSATIFGFFADLLQIVYMPDRSDAALAKELGFNPRHASAIARYRKGFASYNAFQIIEILDAIRRFEAMSKGSGSRQDPYRMLIDLMYRIITAPGTLPV